MCKEIGGRVRKKQKLWNTLKFRFKTSYMSCVKYLIRGLYYEVQSRLKGKEILLRQAPQDPV